MATHIYNLVPSPEDPRDLKFSAPRFFFFSKPLPQAVDLRSKCSPVVDQGDLGSCTANALVSGCREQLLFASKQTFTFLSRLYVYYYERAAEGTANTDSGAYIKDGCDTLLKLGVCTEKTWPYIVNKFTLKPPVIDDREAATFKISKYEKVIGVNNMKAALASGAVLAAGMKVYNQMESREAATTGTVRIPTYNEQPLGGHAVCVVGYTDTPKGINYWKGGGYFLVRNSWGTSWGLNGYFKIAYDYVNMGYVYEAWKLS